MLIHYIVAVPNIQTIMDVFNYQKIKISYLVKFLITDKMHENLEFFRFLC